MQAKRTVVIGFLGTQLDNGRGAARWEKWRPSVALTRHDDKVIDRFELLYTGAQFEHLVRQVSQDIASVSPETELIAHDLPIKDAWDFEDVYAALYDFANKYPFDPDKEEYLIHITTGSHVAQICMFLMTEARYFPGRLVQTSPPKRQNANNPGSYALIDLDLSRYDQIAQRFTREQAAGVAFLKSGIATRNARFNTMIDEIERVAIKSKAPMLLMGPTGAGKSFLARRVYELKKSRHQLDGKFIDLNCATLHGDGAASTLFGHIKGSFTGAGADRPGLLRSAHKGLLFLDEIGELGLDEQAMLLKAIEEKRFFPVGADTEVQSDFQLIAGTNRDLGKEVAAGRFREDLYARINLWSYQLPGLAQRPEDIEPNLDHLLARTGTELGRMVRLSAEARTAYLRYAQSPDALWSGNFRDLSASATRLATLADSGRIGLPLVQAEIARLQWLWQPHKDARDGLSGARAADAINLRALLGEEALDAMDLFDQLQLAAVLRVCRQARTLSDAGRQLFQASRAQRTVVNDADRLRKYLGRFGLDWDSAIRAER